jgi:VWFA-related protein
MLDTLLRSAATQTLEIGNRDAHDSLLYIWQVLHSMESLPGQRTLVLVSPGFLTIDQAAMRLQSQIVNLAASLNITISALDVRGLSSPVMSASQSGVGSTYALQTGQNIQSQADAQRANTAVMADLADSAGGAFIHNTNDLEGGLKALLTAPESLYLLELSLQDIKQNGTYHSLKVEVTQPGLAQPNLKIQARKGYFAPQAAKK